MAQFNFTYEPGITFEQMLGFEVAGRLLSQHLEDDITLNFHVAFTHDLPEGVIGGAVPVTMTTDVDTVQAALAQDVTSTDDAVASSNLNVTIGEDGTLQYTGLVGDGTATGDRLTLTQANAKALGLVGNDATSLDGYILLSTLENTPYDWNTDYGRTGAADHNSLDLLSVILHELGHGLGFVSRVDSLDPVPRNDLGTDRLSVLSLLDLYRYSAESLAQNAQAVTPGQAAYFSIDGGETAIASFSSGVVEVLGGIEGYQASHWANNGLDPVAAASTTTDTRQQTTDFLAALFAQATPATSDDDVPELFDLLVDPTEGASIFDGLSSNVQIDTETGNSLGIMDPALAPGERSDLSALDRQALDVLGYDTVTVAPLVNYATLLEDSVMDLVSTFGIDLGDLIQAGVIQVQNLVEVGLVQPDEIEEFSQIQPNPVWADNLGNGWQNALGGTVVTVQGLIDGGIVTVEAINQALISVEHLLRTNVITVNDLIELNFSGVSVLERDRSLEILEAIADNADLYERRRKRRKATSRSLWQEDDLDLTTVNILSDGAGETAELRVDGVDKASNPRITTVQANAPDADLILRTINLEGTDANDLIIPAYDVFQIIDAGDGNNVVQLGNNGGVVMAGDGNDTVLSLDGSVKATVRDGDNVIVLTGEPGSSVGHTITTRTGDDYIVSTGADFVAISTSVGDDVIDVDGADVFVYGGDGNNVVRLRAIYDVDVYVGNGNDQLQIITNDLATVATGDGTDLIILGDRTGPYYANSGLNDVITLTDFSSTDQLQLYGTPQDYTLVGNELFYQGDVLVHFTTGINFTLSSPQLFFVNESAPAALDRSVVIPGVEEALVTVQDSYTQSTAPTYSIVGGDHAALFAMDATTGDLRFISPPTTNGAYEVMVQAEANGQTDTQLLTVNFTAKATDDQGTGEIRSVPVSPATVVLALNDPSNGSINNHTNGMTDVFMLAAGERNNNVGAGLNEITLDSGIGPMNDLPLPDANDDSVTTLQNNPVTINVFANDTNAVSATLSITDTPVDGTVNIVNNQVVYTPNPGFFGVDTFDYTISDGNGSANTARVTVDVEAPVDLTIETEAIGLYDGKDDETEIDHGVTMRQTITVTNTSNHTATGVVVGTTLQAGLDVWEPNQPIVNEYGNTWVNSRGADKDERFQGNPATVDPTNGTVTVNDVTLASNPSSILSSDSITQGDLTWELGTPLEAGESVTLTFYAQRSDFGLINRSDPFSGSGIFFNHQASLISVDQIDTNSRNDSDSARLNYDSPIVFDLNGDGVQTLSLGEGVMFDMNNTGTAVNTGWLSGEDGFLTVDNDGDGLISSRAELFGGAVGEGFAKLTSFDSNGDDLVNEADAQFGELKLWQDTNENGVTDQGELVSLDSTGITDLDTAYTNVFSTDAQGNIHGEVSSAVKNGSAIEMTDVYFQVEMGG